MKRRLKRWLGVDRLERRIHFLETCERALRVEALSDAARRRLRSYWTDFMPEELRGPGVR